ncbi:hypothetical protein EV715DRAFT_285794 [Schizophyllum commune]
MADNEQEDSRAAPGSSPQQYPGEHFAASCTKRPEPVVFSVGDFSILCDGYDSEDESQTPVASSAANPPTSQVGSDVACRTRYEHGPSSLAVNDDVYDVDSSASDSEADTSVTTELSVTEIMRDLELWNEEDDTPACIEDGFATKAHEDSTVEGLPDLPASAERAGGPQTPSPVDLEE